MTQIRQLKLASRKIKEMSDDIMDMFSECGHSYLKDAGFTLYKASIHIDSYMKEYEKKIAVADDKTEEVEKFGDEFIEGLEE